jgi:hypothetical protein
MRDHGVVDSEFEPFDALLEEVVRERAANGRGFAAPVAGGNVRSMRRGSQWLAAMLLLLGVGVVGAMLGGHSEGDGATPAAPQEPKASQEPKKAGAGESGVVFAEGELPPEWLEFTQSNRTHFWQDPQRVPQPVPTFEQLQALSPDAKDVTCPVLTVEQARMVLPRFVAVERLVLTRTQHFPAPVASSASDETVHLMSLTRPPSPHGEMVAVVASLCTMRSLRLDGSALDAADFAMLAKLPQLEELELAGCDPAVVAQCLPPFGERIQILRLHELFARIRVEDGDPNNAARIATAELALATVVHAATKLPKLECLDLAGSNVLGDAMFAALVGSRLQRLVLSDTPITGRQVALLAVVMPLRELALSGTHLGDADVEAFSKLRQLRRLDVTNTNLTTEGFATLRAVLPAACVIEARPLRRTTDPNDDRIRAR